MPTADHSTTCVRGQKTICIPCSQEQYEPIVDNPEQFRRLLDQQIQDTPELFPPETMLPWRRNDSVMESSP
jgi:hypothetical protein